MSYSPPMEEQIYWDKWSENRDPEAGDILVQKYMPLVTYHVHRVGIAVPKNVSRDELKSFGLMGLFDALNKFDTSRDLKFDTYASFRIRGAIIDGLRKEDWLPRSTREKAKRIEAVAEMLEQKHMRTVTPTEIAEHLRMPVAEVCKIVNEHFLSNVLSIDEFIYEQDDHDAQSYSVKDDATILPEESAIKNEWLEEMAEVITSLNEKEQLVLSLFYHEELTFTEIGEITQLSTSRISQIHTKALMKLKKLLLKKR